MVYKNQNTVRTIRHKIPCKITFDTNLHVNQNTIFVTRTVPLYEQCSVLCPI